MSCLDGRRADGGAEYRNMTHYDVSHVRNIREIHVSQIPTATNAVS
jgi:hypothetical protein